MGSRITSILGTAACAAASGRAATIFLCARNRERFLEEQLASIEHRTFANRVLIASNDDSSDRTLCIPQTFRKSHESAAYLLSHLHGWSVVR
jgi:hypothetical protein